MGGKFTGISVLHKRRVSQLKRAEGFVKENGPKPVSFD
jgi:hypothetical protein